MKWKILSLLSALLVILAACGNGGNTDDNGAAGDPEVDQTRYNNVNDTGERMNRDREYQLIRDSEGDQEDGNGATRYDVSEQAAERITEEVEGINRAYVLTTENTAYVAAGMDVDSTERNDKAGNQGNGQNNAGNDGNLTGTNGGDNEGAGEINGTNGGDQGDTGNADGEDQLSDEVKEQIRDVVQSVDNEIDNVYVSTNPEFLDLTNNYVDDANNGDPVEGMFDQMGNMIQRIFPQNGNN
ncbi:YhcN/YlaJ family sporulation lipoprotein [Virgibacillus xinjiangensis]|uniref:YhcN/YlaJ family sporulation lipoprotein n=1 Tax=Virgibacillus xinjiangensis TaxID=393090 RepID=A0ABV7CR47_9BACI